MFCNLNFCNPSVRLMLTGQKIRTITKFPFCLVQRAHGTYPVKIVRTKQHAVSLFVKRHLYLSICVKRYLFLVRHSKIIAKIIAVHEAE